MVKFSLLVIAIAIGLSSAFISPELSGNSCKCHPNSHERDICGFNKNFLIGLYCDEKAIYTCSKAAEKKGGKAKSEKIFLGACIQVDGDFARCEGGELNI